MRVRIFLTSFEQAFLRELGVANFKTKEHVTLESEKLEYIFKALATRVPSMAHLRVQESRKIQHLVDKLFSLSLRAGLDVKPIPVKWN